MMKLSFGLGGGGDGVVPPTTSNAEMPNEVLLDAKESASTPSPAITLLDTAAVKAIRSDKFLTIASAMRTRSIVVLAVTLLPDLLTAATAAEALSSVVHQTEDVLLSRIAALERDNRRLDAELEASVKEKEDLMKEKEDLRERLETSVAHAAKPLSEIEAVTSSTTLSAETGFHLPVATTANAYANLTDANLSGANLTNVDLTNADLEGAFLLDADLTNADLTDAILEYAILSEAILTLTGANLFDANLTDANLSGANLTDAILFKAVLTGANLTDAILTDADLTDAKLNNAGLSGANLNGAVLEGAILFDADLTGADLTGAILFQADLLDVTWSNTICPDGTNSDDTANGGTCF